MGQEGSARVRALSMKLSVIISVSLVPAPAFAQMAMPSPEAESAALSADMVVVSSREDLVSLQADADDALPAAGPKENGAPLAPQADAENTFLADYNHISTDYEDHDGSSAEKAYRISTAQDMKDFADVVNAQNGQRANNFSGKFIALYNDVNLQELATGDEQYEWTAIGNQYYYHAFTGTFDGGGHTISGLYANTSNSDAAGLFGGGTTSAYLHDFTLQGSVAVAGFTAAGVIGGSFFIGRVENVCTEVDVTNSTYGNAAGITCTTSTSYTGAVFRNCVNKGHISTSATGSTYYAAGIVGRIASYSSDATIESCCNLGTISATSPDANGVTLGGITTKSTNTRLLYKMGNCYNAGQFTTAGGAVNIYGLANIIPTTTSPNYWSSDTAEVGCDQVDNPENVVAKTDAYMKSPAFLVDLGEAYMTGASIRQEYPILKWEENPGSPIITKQPEDGAWALASNLDVKLSVEAKPPPRGRSGPTAR